MSNETLTFEEITQQVADAETVQDIMSRLEARSKNQCNEFDNRRLWNVDSPMPKVCGALFTSASAQINATDDAAMKLAIARAARDAFTKANNEYLNSFGTP